MENRWSDAAATQFITKYGQEWGEDLSVELYLASLIGAEDSLVLHGGGNSSVKTWHTNILGECMPAILVKASGYDMALIEPNGYSGMDLLYLQRLRALRDLSDADMANEFRTHCFDSGAAAPSMETLVHAFIPKKFVDHTHPDAILALTNQIEGKRLIREALGEQVVILDYVTPGFKLAKAAAAAFEQDPSCRGMVLVQHGLVTWGDTASESYRATIELVSRAEAYVAANTRVRLVSSISLPVTVAEKRFTEVAPVIRGLLAEPSGDPDCPWRRFIVKPLINRDVLEFVHSDRGRQVALTPPLTSDHLIRTKPVSLWIDVPDFEDKVELRRQCAEAIQAYADAYDAYVERHVSKMPEGLERMDSRPRTIFMPGVGILCVGKDTEAAAIARDITAHTLAVKSQIAAMGAYCGMSEEDMFIMEYRPLQQAKLDSSELPLLARQVALITGAAGAIGSGIAQELLGHGCHVAATDLDTDNLTRLVSELKASYGTRVLRVPLDITDPASVAHAFGTVIRTWGGIDLIVLNAGVAHVSSLAEMNLETFRRLERINIEGMLIMLSEAARHFRTQGTGGDVVMVSTKNVFAPGAKFGAYSATKTAGHQLARIASQEFAELDVRVNMVAPDAVFSNGARRSGLWAEIGPERMSARGLDPDGLEEYYRNRNLLKARITARHVARAVLFFATRQTPTTGATVPVDGGLPEATPR